jgi:hypothetical protein
MSCIETAPIERKRWAAKPTSRCGSAAADESPSGLEYSPLAVRDDGVDPRPSGLAAAQGTMKKKPWFCCTFPINPLG